MKTTVISVSNNKGGSGKTTLSGNLAFCLAKMDKKVLMIDADMQMNLTRSYDFTQNRDINLYNAIIKEEDLSHYIKKTSYENLDLIISDYMLSALDMKIINKQNREFIFKTILQTIIDSKNYDYVIIDTCPFLGLLNYNILVASDFVLIPVELSAFGIEGLEPLSNFIDEVKINNEKLQILGIVETKVDNRESTTEETRSLLRELFSSKIMKSSIPVDINIKKSQFAGKPICDFAPSSRAALWYLELAKEVNLIVN